MLKKGNEDRGDDQSFREPQKMERVIWQKVVPGVAADRLKAPHVLLDSTLTLLMVVWVLYRVVFSYASSSTLYPCQ